MQPPQPPHTDPEPSPTFEPQPNPLLQRQPATPAVPAAPAVPAVPAAIPGRSPRRQRLAWIVPRVVASIVTILLITVVAHLALGVPLPFGLSDPPPVPADWQTYHDTNGLFSIRLSPTWTVANYSGTSNFIQEILHFSDPALGNASPWVDIYAAPIGNASARHQYCQRISGIPTFFHGLPARVDFKGGWIFETANAHFQIDAAVGSYPEALGGIGPPPPTPTPLPPDTAAADQSLIDTMLGSFQPTDPHALSCP